MAQLQCDLFRPPSLLVLKKEERPIVSRWVIEWTPIGKPTHLPSVQKFSNPGLSRGTHRGILQSSPGSVGGLFLLASPIRMEPVVLLAEPQELCIEIESGACGNEPVILGRAIVVGPLNAI